MQRPLHPNYFFQFGFDENDDDDDGGDDENKTDAVRRKPDSTSFNFIFDLTNFFDENFDENAFLDISFFDHSRLKLYKQFRE
jgi:hypothetical protein